MLPGAVLKGEWEAHLQAGANSKCRGETPGTQTIVPHHITSSFIPVALFELCRLTVLLLLRDALGFSIRILGREAGGGELSGSLA